MSYRIQYFNWDEKSEWQDAIFAGTFDTEEEAQHRLDELYSEWPSRFKKGRVVPMEGTVMTFEEWWDSNEFMMGHFLRIEIKEIGRLAWEAGQKYMLDMQDTPVKVSPVSERRYKMVPIEEKE